MSKPGLPTSDNSSDIANSVLFANRFKIFLAVFVFVLALGYFAFNAFQGAAVYYLTVGELLSLDNRSDDEVFRVNGKLVKDSFARDDNSILATFAISDGTDRITAQHEGVIPDLFFNEHSEIVLLGQFGPEEQFIVNQILVKCPSKYASEEKPA